MGFLVVDKKALRKHAKKMRNSLSADERRSFSDKISEHLLSFFIHTQRFAGQASANPLVVTTYDAFGSEVDLRAFNRALLDCGERLLLPRTSGCPSGVMEFVEVTDLDDETSFNLSSFGIREPLGPSVSDLLAVDLVIVPGILFDRTHARLGYGGGYYDRYFAQRNSIQSQAPLYVGVAFSVQVIDSLPVDKHDLKVDHLVTELGVDLF